MSEVALLVFFSLRCSARTSKWDMVRTVAAATPPGLPQPTRQQRTRPDTGMPSHTLQIISRHTLRVAIASSLLVITGPYSLR